MSLEHLRELRRAGSRPASPVVVILGRAPRHLDDGPGKVVVTRDDVDLSPLVGMPVHVIDLGADNELARRVVPQLEKLSVVLHGICGCYGTVGESPEHERAMERYREALCTE